MSNGPINGRWPSPFNANSKDTIKDGRNILIADCTLRDGEQQAGIVFDRATKVEIAQLLNDIGVYEIEAGTVASSQEDRDAIREICDRKLRAKISVLCRGLNADIDLAVNVGAWGVRLSFPISKLERQHKLKNISDDDYLTRALELTNYAKQRGLYVVFSPYDTTRAELPFLRRLVGVLEKSGTVDRLRIVDTTGCALPSAITFIVSEIRKSAPTLALEIHCHNDFGLACANTLAGVVAGSDYVSSTINGLGERCGNASTEEVTMALEVLYGWRTGINLSLLTKISKRVSELSGDAVASTKPVVGENAFRHESGMVVAGVLKDPFTSEAYDPQIVGQKRQILLGKKSGLVSIDYKVKQLGIDVKEDVYPRLLEQVKELAVSKRRAITDKEFGALCNEVG